MNGSEKLGVHFHYNFHSISPKFLVIMFKNRCVTSVCSYFNIFFSSVNIISGHIFIVLFLNKNYFIININ